MIWFFAYLLTIPAANWMIGNVGTCIPDGPCLIPVGFGLMAPSGVLMIGLALVARDFVHRQLGWKWAIAAIAAGSALSFAVAPPALVMASVAAFALSELLDQAVYAPLYRKRLITAVVASGIVGAVADSLIFLQIAFGSVDYAAGQIVGKLWMVALASAVLWFRPCWHSWGPWRDIGIPEGAEGHGAEQRECTKCGAIDRSRSDWVGHRT